MITATLNIDAFLPDESLNDGGTHEAFFTHTIRSIFEQLVLFKLRKPFLIESDEQYADILRELVHNLETYNLFMDIRCIPNERADQFYPSIAENIINKLEKMKKKEEYTLPLTWGGHAVCLNFVRKRDSIAIRIDNLLSANEDKHTNYTNERGFLVMIPKIIGEIPLKSNYSNFKLLVKYIRNGMSQEKGKKILYDNDQPDDEWKGWENLNISRILTMTKKLEEKSKRFDCFIRQASGNCFYKSHEPGFAIRSNDSKIYQQIILILRTYVTKLTKVGAKGESYATDKRHELENKLKSYWEKEQTTSKYVFGRIIFLENRSSENFLAVGIVSELSEYLNLDTGSTLPNRQQ
jgi:hypothetical protein